MTYTFPFPAPYPDVTGAGLGPLDTVSAGSASVPAPTGNATLDQANIAAAIANVSAAGGGTVLLQAGTYKASSINQAIASVTNSTPGTTWTLVSGSLPPVGSYIIGAGVNGRAPKVLTAAGSSFTTDIAPGSGITAGAVVAVTPGIYLPDGVCLQGVAAPQGNVSSEAVAGGTIVVDSGTGITVFLRGGNGTGGYFGRSKIKDVGIWGSATYGSVGTAYAGVFVNNNASFFELDQVDIAGYYWFGLATDYNTNSIDCRNTGFTYCGHVGATTPSGGIGIDIYNGFVGANINFYDCWGYNLWGFFCVPVNGQGSIALYSCQWNYINTTSAYQSGSAVQISGTNSTLVDCWSETVQGFADVIVGFGYCSIIGGTYSSLTHCMVEVSGPGSICSIVGAASSGKTVATILVNTGNVTWSNMNVQDAEFLNYYNGSAYTNTGILPSQAFGSGTYGGPVLSSSGMSPGTFNGPSASCIWQGSGAPTSVAITAATNSGNAITLTASGTWTVGQIVHIAGATGGTWSVIDGSWVITVGGSGSFQIQTLIAPTGSYSASSGYTDGNIGDIYFRTDTPGTSSQRLYIKSAGTTWTALTI